MDTSAIQFSVHARDAGHVAVAGEIDVCTAPRLAECRAEFSSGDVIVDLAAVEFIDSSGLQALLVGINWSLNGAHDSSFTAPRRRR